MKFVLDSYYRRKTKCNVDWTPAVAGEDNIKKAKVKKVFYLFFHRPVLECCVLPATRGVIDRDICHFPVFSDQVGRLTVEVHHRKALFTLEHVESPTFLGLKTIKKDMCIPTRSLIHHKFKSSNLRLSYPRYPIPYEMIIVTHSRPLECYNQRLESNASLVRILLPF